MRVKRLMTNRSEMARKRSNKEDGKGKESQPPSREWTYSKCSNNDLLNLVSEGLLQGKDLVYWRPSFHQSLPMENVDKIVSLYHFAERGLALPACSFFRGLLYFYGLELHHLNLNSICHIAIFIHFCEAFLGIEPHWDLFCHLFRVKPQPTSKNPSIVGGTGIQLRQHAGEKYFSYKFPSNIAGWKNHWFYIGNHAPQLPERSGEPPVQQPEWNIEPSKGDMDQVDELLALIAAHKEMGVTCVSVMLLFFKHRIQPIQQRHTLGFEYMGAENPSRMCIEELTDDAGLIRVKQVLLDVNTVPYIPELFSTQNPPEPVSFRLLGILYVVLELPLTENPLQGHMALYRIYPQQFDIPRPYHLLPSAEAEAKRAQSSDDLPSSETTESEIPLAEKAAGGKTNKNNSPGSSVELVEALLSIPRGRCVVRKRKANVVESTRYGTAILWNCQVLWLLDAYFICVAVLLLLPTPSAERWSGPHLLEMMFQQMVLQKLLRWICQLFL
jgi:hypothetical protein